MKCGFRSCFMLSYLAIAIDEAGVKSSFILNNVIYFDAICSRSRTRHTSTSSTHSQSGITAASSTETQSSIKVAPINNSTAPLVTDKGEMAACWDVVILRLFKLLLMQDWSTPHFLSKLIVKKPAKFIYYICVNSLI